MSNKYKVVSLFAGCGGLDLGLMGGFEAQKREWKKNPFQVIWANDFNKCATESYKAYVGEHVFCADINAVLDTPEEYSFPQTADIVVGGFPCQPFSHAGLRLGLNDRRGSLYLAMRETIRRLRPKAFIAENVRGILTIEKGETIKKIVADFASLGYRVNYHLYLASDYDVPQSRQRVLIVGIREDLGFEFVPPNPTSAEQPPNVKDAIDDLAKLPEGAKPNHFWSKARKNKGQGNNRVNADVPAPTMRAEHHGNIEYHYSEDRRLSAREAARIQTFPDNMVFVPSTSAAYRQIGNAVPPVLAWHVGKALAAQLVAAESGRK